MEAFLSAVLPSIVDEALSYSFIVFQGKQELIKKLQARLGGYSDWMPANWRVVVVVDRDSDHCVDLKRQLEIIVARTGLVSRRAAGSGSWQVATRIAIEELEAWYFGDWSAVVAGYPRVPTDIPRKQGFRDPDDIRGGTHEALQRILARAGYYGQGLPKLTVARTIGPHFRPERCTSQSFERFRDALLEACE